MPCLTVSENAKTNLMARRKPQKFSPENKEVINRLTIHIYNNVFGFETLFLCGTPCFHTEDEYTSLTRITGLRDFWPVWPLGWHKP